MKKFIIPILAVLTISACKKEAATALVQDEISSFGKIITEYTLPDDANDEVKRIAEAVYSPDYTFGITDNPNYGVFSSSPEYDIFISGSSPETVGLTLDGTSYNQSGGQWFLQSIDLKQYYGKTVHVEITNDGSSSFDGSMYVPEPVKTPLLGSNMSIGRTGNVLNWEVDQNYPANKIALVYSLYNTSGINDLTGEIDRGILLIDNNGSYSIDHLLTNIEVQKIYFRLVSGSAVATQINGKKVMFSIKTYDHHLYVVN